MADTRRRTSERIERQIELSAERSSANSSRARQRRSRRFSGTTASIPAVEARQPVSARVSGAVRPRKGRKLTGGDLQMPPVMARGGFEGMALRKPRRSISRKRYDVALGRVTGSDIPGAELQLPSLPGLHLGWRMISGVMILALALCLFFVWKSPALRISSVEAEGLQRLTLADLNAVLGVYDKSIFQVNARQIEEELSRFFPELASVDVQVNLPNSIKIVATERQPVLSWLMNDNEVWVDAEGVSFPMRGDPGTLVRVKAQSAPPGSLPEVNEEAALVMAILPGGQPVLEAALKLQPELVATILAMSAEAPEDAVMLYNTEHGLGWNDPKDWKVFFGTDIGEIDMKLLVYKSLVTELEREGIKPAFISVEYLHAPYYRMER